MNTLQPSECFRWLLLLALSVVLWNGQPPSFSLYAADDEPTASELAAIRAAEEARISAIDSIYGTVVAIYGNDRKGGGSGVLFDPAGFALTNHHVVAAAGLDGWAGLADGKLYRWKLIGTDPGGDVAIIQLQGQDKFPVAPLADSEKVRVGDWAMAMGNPFVLAEDQRPTVTLGIVSGVHRYQPGSGMNQLVYGNCIQVDSSINPGNSGGPLFNLRGEVIGINGRGSFEERGRVNVGLGYAISANQVRNFIPELLATKMAQHGTLDAQFGNRLGGVICQSLNLDSAVAKAGLELADRLVSFEGVKINDANQFTNLVTIYPAGWPVTLTFEREGVQKTVTVRLTSLPYEPIVKEQPKIQSVPEKPAEEKKPEERKPADKKPVDDKPAEPTFQEEKQGEAKKDEEKKDEEQPAEKPQPKNPAPQIKMPAQKPNFGKAGQIRDAKLNDTIAREIAGRWQSAARADGFVDSTDFGLTLHSDVLRQEAKVGTQSLTFTAGGMVLARYEIDGKVTIAGCDGKTYWLQTADKPAQEISAAKAHRDPHFAQATVLAGLLQKELWQAAGKLALDGSDKAAGRLCYRLSLTDKDSEQLFVWLSVVNDKLQPEIQLVKSGVGIEDDEPIASTIYRQWKTVANLSVPHERTLVRKLSEEELLRIVTTNVTTLGKVEPELFQMPK
ncbi:Periplasmic serine endoprotease DegP precursor [Anatilimnocola aggregata]|uniref:Periplasmic serine endoprotease DegP n=1 Tax=Anatilimnocola aggregata TaxID=2528021 RepID=A0A517YHA4_9BACT|nr:trypsin-like peptidase domain-containing protein [Anatilimnocola aggregata]QDU29617.1 Periplasmic serine endoprotease DegP precursor [Anatilimnocola aggregata]